MNAGPEVEVGKCDYCAGRGRAVAVSMSGRTPFNARICLACARAAADAITEAEEEAAAQEEWIERSTR